MLGFFTKKNRNEIDGEWRTVAELRVGQSIAVPKDGVIDAHKSGQIDSREWMGEDDLLWDEIESIEYIGTEQVWDIEVEGTHNFVGNNIFAHNTYMNGNLGVGTSTPYNQLQIATTSGAGFKPQFTLTDMSGGTNGKHWNLSSLGGNFYLGTSTDAYATSSISALEIGPWYKMIDKVSSPAFPRSLFNSSFVNV